MSDIAAFAQPRETSASPEARPIVPLRLRDVGLRLGESDILEGISLDLPPSGCSVVMGPNGAGKSQLLKMLHGLVQPTSGSIDWNGTSMTEAMPRQAMVFQKPVLLRRSVAANIDFVLRSRGRDRAMTLALLTQVGLADKARMAARRLSGGEAQRLALARALTTEPDVLFLDEPTASLDPTSVMAIETIVARIKARGTKIIFVTHDIGQARRLADDVIFLNRGRLCEHTPATVFFKSPETAPARDYLSGRIVI